MLCCVCLLIARSVFFDDFPMADPSTVTRLPAAVTRPSFLPQKDRQPSSRPKQAKRKLLPEERATRKAHQEATEKEYKGDVQEIQETVWQACEGLKTKYGNHTTEYFHDDVMSRPRLSAHEPRKINRWNVYERMEVERANAGMSDPVQRRYCLRLSPCHIAHRVLFPQSSHLDSGRSPSATRNSWREYARSGTP